MNTRVDILTLKIFCDAKIFLAGPSWTILDYLGLSSSVRLMPTCVFTINRLLKYVCSLLPAKPFQEYPSLPFIY